MNTNLLYIPFRQTNRLDLGNELRSIIKRDYFQTPSLFETDLLYVSKLRNEISNLKNESIKANDENLIKEYCAQLRNISKRFSDDCVEFIWYGTLGYNRSRPYHIHSLKVEKYNIIYQLGSLYSQLALLESRQTEEGLKKACSYFQNSAGAFAYLLSELQDRETKEIESSPQISPDFDIETLECLKYIGLAQAQEMIWQKALLNSSIKDSIIARLSIQISEFYSHALKHGNTSEFIRLEFINHIAVKLYHFKAAANLRASIMSLDNFQYGEQVAYLKVSFCNCAAAQKYSKYVSSTVLEDLHGLSDTIANMLRVAEKENNLVYLKAVPSEKDLKVISGAPMVKPILPELDSTSYRNIFKELLPYLVIQAARSYRERQSNFLSEKLIIPLSTTNNLARKFLTERNLPASIDAIQKPENLPDSIVEHSQDIISCGGIGIIEDSLLEISKLVSKSNEILDGCKTRLENEANEDRLMRNRFGNVWNRISSAEAGRDLITRVSKMETYLSQAKEGDKYISSQYEEINLYLNLYCGGYEKLIRQIPSSNYSKLDSKVSNIVNELRVCIRELMILEKKRKDVLTEVEIESRNNNIFYNIIDEYKKNQSRMQRADGQIDELALEAVYEKHMSSFNRFFRYLEDLKEKQLSLENRVDFLNNEFTSEYQNNDESKLRRQEILQNLEAAYTRYLELISHLNEGSKFYSDFILKSNAVLKDCDEFTLNRRFEARDLEEFIAQDVEERNNALDSNSNSNFTQVQHDINSNVPLIASKLKNNTWNPNRDIKFE